MAYVSSWGEANPGGGQDEIARYRECALVERTGVQMPQHSLSPRSSTSPCCVPRRYLEKSRKTVIKASDLLKEICGYLEVPL